MLKKQKRYDSLYLDIAFRVAEMSYAKRAQVGCVVVKDGRIISMGWNGMPSGWDNECEETSFFGLDGKQYATGLQTTKIQVLHAESNAIAKLARDGESSLGASMYITMSPCMECAKLIHQSGIKRLVYSEHYRDASGLNFLTTTPNFEIVKMELSDG